MLERDRHPLRGAPRSLSSVEGACCTIIPFLAELSDGAPVRPLRGGGKVGTSVEFSAKGQDAPNSEGLGQVWRRRLTFVRIVQRSGSCIVQRNMRPAPARYGSDGQLTKALVVRAKGRNERPGKDVTP